MKAKLQELARRDLNRVLLYGAGRHTLKVGEVLGTSPVQILGIVDDRRGERGERMWNWPILAPAEALKHGAQAVVISSDGMEQRLYESALRWFQSSGVSVHRLYTAGSAGCSGRIEPFTDSQNRTFYPIVGYRDHVKPGWEELLRLNPGERPPPTIEQAEASLYTARQRVHLLDRYLRIHGFSVTGRDALEVGCWDGACVHALAASGCRRAVGIDYQDYFLFNVEPEEITDAQRRKGGESLCRMQEAIARAAPNLLDRANDAPKATPVELLIDDITGPRLDDSQFDLICSWDTLEHIVPPEAGFAAMSRLLRPGGLCFHQYSAFTSHPGGHALCTLDFPWGHVRLGADDMDRYLRQYRPDEYPHAIRHYQKFLNRMTLADAERLATAHGFRVIDKTVWLNRQLFEEEFDPVCLEDARRHHPNLTFADMIHTDIWLLLEMDSEHTQHERPDIRIDG
jgi:SAM-dependent methyltransferase